MNKKVNVFLMDDHKLIVQGLSMRLADEDDIEVCGTALSIHDALPLIETTNPHVIVTDLSFPDGNGLDFVKSLKLRLPKIACIVVSMHDERIYGKRCIRSGASGYLMKSQPFEDVVDAIRVAAQGKKYISEQLRKELEYTSVEMDELSSIDALTNREFEIYCLIGEGYRPRHITEKLNISVDTVSVHCRNIRTKLLLDDMTQLIENAVNHFNSSS